MAIDLLDASETTAPITPITPRYYRIGKEKFKGKVLNKNLEAVFSDVC